MHRLSYKIHNVSTLPRRVSTLPRRVKPVIYTRDLKVNAIGDITDITYYVGKGIILFTFFYTSLNYFHYKKLREDQEKNEDDKKPKNK